ncbi:GDP-mannose 4,6-dehydratase [Nocardioides sp.]|uniref:GDP-mannose 4,6-dehydratase n=1 Tax=Nocardioides sp. TaxID=35761 RepID=UPI00261438F6|nr:GDP-mannose 4,6-dehydratase [Nocardioides sp.]
MSLPVSPAGPPTRAFVTGATGQDGSYLCERLLAEGVEVHALHHAPSSPSLAGQDWADQVIWHDGDLLDAAAVTALIGEVEAGEIYHLAGASSVAASWADPVGTSALTGQGALTVFEAAWWVQERTGAPVRVVQASSAEIFGTPAQSPQTETTLIRPVSPYGAAKAFAHHLAAVYRGRGLAVAATILYNHESPRRPTSFVTRKITSTVAAIARGEASELVLGNLDARRDWGWAPDYVDAMVRANRAADADDYVIATGVAHTVADFVEAAFAAADIVEWQHLVRTDPAFVRPVDPATQVGDATHARTALGWSPTVSFPDVVAAMVAADLDGAPTR